MLKNFGWHGKICIMIKWKGNRLETCMRLWSSFCKKMFYIHSNTLEIYILNIAVVYRMVGYRFFHFLFSVFFLFLLDCSSFFSDYHVLLNVERNGNDRLFLDSTEKGWDCFKCEDWLTGNPCSIADLTPVHVTLREGSRLKHRAGEEETGKKGGERKGGIRMKGGKESQWERKESNS